MLHLQDGTCSKVCVWAGVKGVGVCEFVFWMKHIFRSVEQEWGGCVLQPPFYYCDDAWSDWCSLWFSVCDTALWVYDSACVCDTAQCLSVYDCITSQFLLHHASFTFSSQGKSGCKCKFLTKRMCFFLHCTCRSAFSFSVIAITLTQTCSFSL